MLTYLNSITSEVCKMHVFHARVRENNAKMYAVLSKLNQRKKHRKYKTSTEKYYRSMEKYGIIFSL